MARQVLRQSEWRGSGRVHITACTFETERDTESRGVTEIVIARPTGTCFVQENFNSPTGIGDQVMELGVQSDAAGFRSASSSSGAVSSLASGEQDPDRVSTAAIG